MVYSDILLRYTDVLLLLLRFVSIDYFRCHNILLPPSRLRCGLPIAVLNKCRHKSVSSQYGYTTGETAPNKKPPFLIPSERETRKKTQDGTPGQVWMLCTHSVLPECQNQCPQNARSRCQEQSTSLSYSRATYCQFPASFPRWCVQAPSLTVVCSLSLEIVSLGPEGDAEDPCRACSLIWIRFWRVVYWV